MTSEQRVLYDIADLLGLRLECVKCHAAIDYAPGSKFPIEVPAQCPSCRETWKDSLRPGTSVLIEQVIAQLRRLQEVESAAPSTYRLRFHFGSPAPARQP